MSESMLGGRVCEGVSGGGGLEGDGEEARRWGGSAEASAADGDVGRACATEPRSGKRALLREFTAGDNSELDQFHERAEPDSFHESSASDPSPERGEMRTAAEGVLEEECGVDPEEPRRPRLSGGRGTCGSRRRGGAAGGRESSRDPSDGSAGMRGTAGDWPNAAGMPARLVPERLTAEQRLLLLDTWQRSGLPAGDFAVLVGISKHTLYAWKKKFEREGPGGLMDQPRGVAKGSRLPELTKRTILLLKQTHPDWGCQRISDVLYRGPALPASPESVARVLREAGYTLQEEATRPHPDRMRHFERACPNQLWQTDLFTFMLKRQNRRVYLVAFMDDHSRFIVGYGLHASQSTALVLEVLRAALASYPAPTEILTDNGTQYVTWRGKSQFTRELEKRGIQQIVARPRHPQTLGKIERFWGTLWRECVETAVFVDLGDARRRIGLFIDHYNFQRPHQGIEGLAPADRYFGAAEEVKRTLAARVAANALELARQGVPKEALYLTGQVGGRPVSLHAEGERVILTGPEGTRQEIDLAAAQSSDNALSMMAPVCPAGVVDAEVVDEAEPLPGTSPLDEGLRRIAESLESAAGGAP